MIWRVRRVNRQLLPSPSPIYAGQSMLSHFDVQQSQDVNGILQAPSMMDAHGDFPTVRLHSLPSPTWFVKGQTALI